MSQIMNSVPRSHKFALAGLLMICLPSVGSASALSQDRSRPETIESTERGTETQMGKEFAVTLTIYEYSPRADKQILIDAFQNGKNQGCIETSNVADFALDLAPGQQHKMKALVTVA